MIKSIKKNSVYNIIRLSSSTLLSLITLPYVSRILLTENIGKINFGLSIVNYVSLIASLGINTYAIRECSKVRDNKEELSLVSSQIFSINIITTFIAYIILAIILLLHHKLYNYRLLIIIQSLSIVASTVGTDWINSAMEDFKYITIRTVIFQIISLFLIFMFVSKQSDYIKYAIIGLISTSGANLTNIWYRKRYCNIHFTKNIEWSHHLLPILYLFVMLLAQTIFHSVDLTMLGLMYGDHEVGIYSIAVKTLNLINQLIGSILWIIMPRMSYYFAKDDFEKINALLRKVLGFNLLLGFPCIVGTFILAKDIIRIIAGNAFSESALILQILMIGFLFSLVGGNLLGNAVLLPARQEKYYMIVCCITAIINVLGNYIFIPKFGAKAAAGTTAVCSLIILILLLLKMDKRIRIVKIKNIFLSPIVGCSGIICVCRFASIIKKIEIRVIISLICSILVYGFIQILMKNELIDEVLKHFQQKYGIY